ncbi:MAG: hypothetical protein ACOYXU_02985 [Nitrospirota bacterium]
MDAEPREFLTQQIALLDRRFQQFDHRLDAIDGRCQAASVKMKAEHFIDAGRR